MRIHTGKKPYPCTLCGVRFAQLGSLKRHMRTHLVRSLMSAVFVEPYKSFVKPYKSYKCSVCGAAFTSGVILRHT